ncbi:glutamate-1-semialdehyde 2,1-aminomutase [Oligoflexus tunisiensis]|uniref:glutamate-1-semialdehyde 2,1-aminomutase n=1 Tax=Oligoflexus tunisiensis TaxID=708132 RepID=UPI000B2D10EF|nr:glutamate-1-semialdehyde 2,1-aminomutase [Oligoflexus tunisiensis]
MNSTNKTTLYYRERAHRFIPAGAHTYSKADDQFPGNAPPFIDRASGARCWDTDGQEYIDYGMGIFAVSLGHAFPSVTERIGRQLERGNAFTRPSILEGELAERLCNLIPCAEMVKFAKNGSDVTSAAIRLARFHTGGSYVVRCQEQPFHSFCDWFIGSTSRAGGVPQAVRDLTLKFRYNDLDSLEQLFAEKGRDIACVIMEPADVQSPQPGFLQGVRELCDRHGALLIFDEIITGFRWHLRGAQFFYDVTPDLATFGKGMANGFPCAALVGRREIMEHGNMNGPVFLLSCTYGSELVGLTAALATLDRFEDQDVIAHIWKYGADLQEGLRLRIERHGLSSRVEVRGLPCRPSLWFASEEGSFSYELKTLFMQEMIERHILMERICISLSHGHDELTMTLAAADESFAVLAKVLEAGTMREHLRGPVARPVFLY